MTRAAVLAGSLLLGTLPAWSQFSLRESNEDLFLKRPCAQQWPPSEVACPKEHAEFVRRLKNMPIKKRDRIQELEDRVQELEMRLEERR